MNNKIKIPCWLGGGILFLGLAMFSGRFEFLVEGFVIGSILGWVYGKWVERFGWKNSPYWLRGAIIGGAITAISFINYWICISTASDSPGFFCLPYLMFSPMAPISLLFDSYTHITSYELLAITSILVWSIIGSAVGGLLSLIKRKRAHH